MIEKCRVPGETWEEFHNRPGRDPFGWTKKRFEKTMKECIIPPKRGSAVQHNNMVDHPSHYTNGKIECIDALESATEGLNGIEAVCTANAIKYMWRWKHKNGAEDIKKAIWYLNKLLEKIGE